MEEQKRQVAPLKWRGNTVGERRRMRNERKKRKRYQRRKRMAINKEDKIKELAECLQGEIREKERILYLARKYFLKWRQSRKENKVQIILQEKIAKQHLSSRFGKRPKVMALKVFPVYEYRACH